MTSHEGNPFDDAVAMLDEQAIAKSAGVVGALKAASATSPGDAAQVAQVARRSGLSEGQAETVLGGGTGPQKAAAINGFDEALRMSDRAQSWLFTARNAVLAQDDLESIAGIDRGIISLRRQQTLWDDLRDSGETGLESISSTYYYLAFLNGAIDEDAAATGIAESERRKLALRQGKSSSLRQFDRELEESSGFGQLIPFLTNPRGAAAFITEQFSQSLPVLVSGGGGALAGLAGGPFGAIAGATAGTFGGGVFVEMGGRIGERLIESGFDLTSEESIKAAFRNTSLMADIEHEAFLKGVGTASVDAIGILIGAGVLTRGGRAAIRTKKVVAKAKGLKRVGQVSRAVGVETVGEVVGEAGGELLATGEINIDEAILEGIASLGQSGAQVGLTGALKGSRRAAVEAVSRASQALSDGEAAKGAMDSLGGGKLRGRDPATLRDLIDSLSEGQDRERLRAMIDIGTWNEIWREAGEDPAAELSRILPVVGPEIYRGAGNDGQLAIPLGTFMEAYAGSPQQDALIDNVRFREGGMTIAEADVVFERVKGEAAAAAQGEDPVSVTSAEVSRIDAEIEALGEVDPLPPELEALPVEELEKLVELDQAQAANRQPIGSQQADPAVQEALDKARIADPIGFSRSVKAAVLAQQKVTAVAAASSASEARRGQAASVTDAVNDLHGQMVAAGRSESEAAAVAPILPRFLDVLSRRFPEMGTFSELFERFTANVNRGAGDRRRATQTTEPIPDRGAQVRRQEVLQGLEAEAAVETPAETPVAPPETAAEAPVDEIQELEGPGTPPTAEAVPVEEQEVEPAPAVPAANSPRRLVGNKTTIHTITKTYEAVYEIREADDITPSHRVEARGGLLDYIPDPNYPAGLQPRAYHALPAEQAKVERFAVNVPEKFGLFLGDSQTPTDGSPSISPDGVVINGNGRVMALKVAKSIGTFDAYVEGLKADAAAKGLDVSGIDGMEAPILVRVVDLDAASQEAASFAREGNEPLTQAQSTEQRMEALAGIIPDEALRLQIPEGSTLGEFLSGGSAQARAVLRSIEQAIPESMRPAFFSEPGVLTSEGKVSITELALSAVIDRTAIENQRPTVAAMVRKAIPQLAAVRSELVDSLDIRSDLEAALRFGRDELDDFRQAEGQQLLGGKDPFADLDPVQASLVRIIQKNIRRDTALRNVLQAYVSFSRGSTFMGQAGVTREEALTHASEVTEGGTKSADTVAALGAPVLNQAQAEDRAAFVELVESGAGWEEIEAHPFLLKALKAIKAIPQTNLDPLYADRRAWTAQRRYVIGDRTDVTHDEIMVHLAKVARELAWVDDGKAPGVIRREKNAVIVIGPPAAGKSTFSNKIAQKWGAAIIDADEAKKTIPEFGNGVGAPAVHGESSDLNWDVWVESMKTGENQVIPTLGDDAVSLRHRMSVLLEAGYKIHLVNMQVSPETAYRRMLLRFIRTGRILTPSFVRSVGDKPTKMFGSIKSEFASYASVENESQFGGPKAVLDSSGPGDPLEGVELRLQRVRRGVGAGGPQAPGRGPGLAAQGQVQGQAPSGTAVELAQSRRGFTRLGGDPGGRRSFDIRVLSSANRSTVLHELGHVFFEILGDLAGDTNAPQALKDEYQIALNFIGYETREDHLAALDEIRSLQVSGADPDRLAELLKPIEKWARAFEGYLLEGKAPSIELKRSFAAFRSWMIRIYRDLAGLNIELTDSVRGLFDRLLATEDEILAAEQERGAAGVPDAALAGLSPKERATYDRALDDAARTAREALTRDVMKSQARALKDERREEVGKVAAELLDMANQSPGPVALSVMADGVMPDGSPLPEGMTQEKLDRREVEEVYGADSAKAKALHKAGVLVGPEQGGLALHQGAEAFGFNTGDELVEGLIAATKKDRLIQAEARRIVRARNPELFDSPQGMRELATRAVASKERSRLLSADLNALLRMAERERETAGAELGRAMRRADTAERADAAGDAARSLEQGLRRRAFDGLFGRDFREQVSREAAEALASTSVRDIVPNRFLAAARRESRKATIFVQRGEFQSAALAKRREIVNHESHRQALKIRKKSDSGIARGKKLASPSFQGRVGKGGQDRLLQMNKLLARFGLASPPLPPGQVDVPFTEWLDAIETQTDGFGPDVMPWLRDERNTVEWMDLDPVQQQDVRDALEQIYKMATDVGKFMDERRKTTVAESRKQLAATIRANKKSRGKDTRDRDGGLREYVASHGAIDRFALQFDGLSPGGVAFDLLIRPKNEAAAAEGIDGERVKKALDVIIKLLTREDRKNWQERRSIPGVSKTLNLQERIGVALNWGNQQGRDRLTNDRGTGLFTADEVQTILATLEPRHAEMVKLTHELEDSFWERSKRLWQSLKGVAPPKVEAIPFQTVSPDGTVIEWEGGYHRLKYEGRREEDDSLEKQAQLLRGGRGIRVTTRSGSHNQRLENVGLPVRLDFGVVTSHISQVMHELSHLVPIRDMQAVLQGDDVREAIIDRYGSAVYQQFKDTYNDIATGDFAANDAIDRGLGYLRTGAVVYRLGMKISTNLINLAGYSNTVVHLGQISGKGPAHGAFLLAKAMGRLLRNPTALRQARIEIDERSPAMRQRSTNFMREMSEQSRRFRKPSAGRELQSKIMDWSFIPLAFTQSIVDTPTWLAAYDMAQEMFPGDSAKQIAIADQAVISSQSGGQVGELTAVQRGSQAKKVWTTFMGYMVRTMNLTATSASRVKFNDPATVFRFAGELIALYIAPTIYSVMIQRLLRGDTDDDDPLGLEEVGLESIGMFMSQFVFVREVSGAVQGFSDYKGPVGASVFDVVGRLWSESMQGELDKGLGRAISDTVGVGLHLPTQQFLESLNGFRAYLDGDAEIQNILLGPPRDR